jgi:chorismate mutase
MTKVRGIRGAVRVDSNTKSGILLSTRKLLQNMLLSNLVDKEDIVSIFFTATDDLNAEFPAYATRDMDLNTVPLLCAREIAVPGSMDRLVRILIHVNTDKTQSEIKHQYLGETSMLRPDLNTGGNDDDSRHEI